MKNKARNYKKITLLVVTVVIIIAVIITTGIIVGANSPAKRYEKQLSLGEHYLSKEKYKMAIAAFTKAIEIELKQVTAYISLAKAYSEAGDSDMAEEVLKEATEMIQTEIEEGDGSISEAALEKMQKIGSASIRDVVTFGTY